MPQRYITARLSFRRGTKDKWETENPILNEGEPGFEVDSNRLKVGDGETSWNDLNYYKVGDSEASDTFIHNGELLPDYINSISAAVEYLGHQFKLMREQGMEDFNAGVSGGSPKRSIRVRWIHTFGKGILSFEDGTSILLSLTLKGAESSFEDGTTLSFLAVMSLIIGKAP